MRIDEKCKDDCTAGKLLLECGTELCGIAGLKSEIIEQTIIN